MFKCCVIRRPDPLNLPYRGTLNVRMERLNFLLLLFFMRIDSERGLGNFQQHLTNERIKLHLWSMLFGVLNLFENR